MIMRNLTGADFVRLLDKDIFHEIAGAADALHLECYVVGGYVRDLFLERPSNDIDVVVVGSGIEVARALKERLGKSARLSVFRNFGTAQVKYHGLEVEFVGARKESYRHDSRKPHVEDGTLQDDLNRRDFTINALAVCLNQKRFGTLIDSFDGVMDMEKGILATPLDPDITFSDDPLRMMRCVRFATQLNFQIEEETYTALSRNADRLKIISGERIADELNKIMLAPHPSIGFYYMHDTGLLQLILPELCALDVVETRNGKSHKNNYLHTLEVLENLCRAQNKAAEASSVLPAGEKAAGNPEDGPAQADGSLTAKDRHLYLRWAALLHDIGKAKCKRWDPVQGWSFHNHNLVGSKMVPQIFRRLKLPMDAKMKFVQKLVYLHMRPIAIADDQVTDSAVRRLINDAGGDVGDLMMLCEADITSKNHLRKQHFLDNFHIVREKLKDLEERDYKRLLQPCIDGNEIMEMFHLRPSREVGTLKQTLKDAVLDNKVPNERGPLMQLLKRKAHEMGLDD
jgi:tRNA nucleotidyltransferase/poly(A) polymerase